MGYDQVMERIIDILFAIGYKIVSIPFLFFIRLPWFVKLFFGVLLGLVMLGLVVWLLRNRDAWRGVDF